jgi:hypothetical protein
MFSWCLRVVLTCDRAERAKRAKDVELSNEKPFRPSNPLKKGSFGIPGTTLGGKGKGVSGEYGYLEQVNSFLK